MAMLFQRGPNPIWFMANHTAQPLDDSYWAFFLTNDLPYIPQAVYHSPNGTPWSNPIEFQPSSGLPNDLFFDPSLVYRIEIRQGNMQSDPLIWLIQDYTVGSGGSGGNTDNILTSENLLTNPQFSDIYFSSPLTISTAGTYDIAPGWQLKLVGTGTVSTIITQDVTAGTDGIAGNPAYFLRFQNSGWTSATLFQRLSNNGSLFSQGAVGIAFSAFATSSSETLPVNYVQSDSGTSREILSADVNTGSFQQFSGSIDLPISTNTDTGTAGYVDIQFALPGDSDLSISNVQFTGQESALSNPAIAPVYQEIPYPRIVDHEFNVYRDSIILQPKDSILVGWEFAKNPWQFSPTSGTTATANGYTADQTIVISQAYVDSATGSNVSLKQASAANNFGLQVTALTAHNQFGILQYLDPTITWPYWGLKVSALVKAFITTTHSSSVKVKMRLLYSNGLPSSTSQHVPVASWTEGGDPVFAGGTIGIAPRNDPSWLLGAGPQEFAFDGFELPSNSAADRTLGVMVYTVGNMDQNATADFIVIQDVSLVPNDFAIASNPKPWDAVLRECQFYYEKSYDTDTLPGTASSEKGMLMALQSVFFDSGGGNVWTVRPAPFNIVFNTVKRNIPTVTLIGPITGTSATVRANVYVGGPANNSASVAATSWTQESLGRKSAYYESNAGTVLVSSSAASASDSATGLILFQYTADARLG